MMIPTTPTPAVKKEEKENKQVNNKSPVTTPPPPPEKLPAAAADDDQQKPAKKNDSNTNAAKVEELPKEKKVEKPAEDKRSNINAGGVDDNNKQEDQEKGKKSPKDGKNAADEKPEGENDKVKNQPEEKTRDLDDIKEKKSVAQGEKDEKLDKKETDNIRDKDGSKTITNYGADENENLASKLKKHRRMFNLALVTILALAIGIFVSDLFKSLRRRIQN